MAVTTAVVVGIAATATSAGMSFSQARQQKKLAQQAKQDANEAMAAARKKLQVNYYDQLAVQKEPYELQREALLSQGAQALQAGVEGESRGAAAVAGRVAMAQNEAQAGVRTAMGKEMGDLAKLSAQEDSRLRDIGIQLDLGEVEGAQAAAANAETARANAIAQGMQSVTSLAQQGMQMAPLYDQNFGAQKAALGKMTFTPEQTATLPQIGGQPFDPAAIGQMNNLQYMRFKAGLSPEQQQTLFFNPQYQQNYNPFDPYRGSFESSNGGQ
jgi:hypothetical protein